MATVIKAGGRLQNEVAVRGAAFNLSDVAEQASRHLAEMRRQADEILAQARREAEEIRRQAQEQGRGQAVRDAIKTLQAEVDRQWTTVRPAIDQLRRELMQEKQAWLEQWEKNAVQLALAIAARIIRREVRSDPTIPLTLIRESLQLAAGSDQVRVYLNPHDREALGDAAALLAADLAAVAAVEIVDDPQLTPGGCRVETRFGVIDQQIESQLRRFEQELIDSE